MTAEENRDYDNLILLCRQHAKEIDDTPGHYPADLLTRVEAISGGSLEAGCDAPASIERC